MICERIVRLFNRARQKLNLRVWFLTIAISPDEVPFHNFENFVQIMGIGAV